MKLAAFRRVVAVMVAAGSAVALAAGCGAQSGSSGTSQGAPPVAGKKVVAATTWEAAYAKAAGAQDVKVIVPPSVHHAPDYDPKPSDLAAVADADIVLYAPFEGFVNKLKEAGGSKAHLEQVNLDNSPNNVRSEVRRLAGMLGTQGAAESWLHQFDATVQDTSNQMHGAWRDGKPPRVIAQTFVTYVAGMAGADTVGTYGPDAVSPAQLADLSGKHPDLVLDNSHMSTGTVLPDQPAKQVALVNYPGQDLDLLSVYRTDADLVVKALRS